jgi:poly-beta-1,6-N-acetyl-D-glucosamine synthase
MAPKDILGPTMQVMHKETPDCEPILTCSAGIMAYNEAGNIGAALASVLRQSPAGARIDEVIVVASGCTDQTVPIAKAIAERDARVRVVEQLRREGKASAINVFMQNARSPVLLMFGADVILKDGTVEALLRHFHDETVGMVGAHPVPVNDERTFLGHTAHLLWRLHDRIALAHPKLGEAVAFRNVLPGIPVDTPVDEISIQALISQLKYRLVYEPNAIVYNRGPATVADFLKQRRRIAAGHFQIRRQQGYSSPTMSVWQAARALVSTTDAFATPQAACWTAGAVTLEAWARTLGALDDRRRREHHTWQMVDSTKQPIADGASPQRAQSVLVFRIVAFGQHELELGAHRAQLLHRGVMQQIRRLLGPGCIVSAERNGTVVVVVPDERGEAERRAQQTIDTIEASPLYVNGDQHPVPVRLSCGIIAFLQSGDATAVTVPRSADVPQPA